jgi:hypothetical protein
MLLRHPLPHRSCPPSPPPPPHPPFLLLASVFCVVCLSTRNHPMSPGLARVFFRASERPCSSPSASGSFSAHSYAEAGMPFFTVSLIATCFTNRLLMGCQGGSVSSLVTKYDKFRRLICATLLHWLYLAQSRAAHCVRGGRIVYTSQLGG